VASHVWRECNKFEIPPRFGGIFVFRVFVIVRFKRAKNMETGGVVSLSNKPLFMEPNQIKDADILDILFEDNRGSSAARTKVASEVSTLLRPKL
jgi:hypothetical protein